MSTDPMGPSDSGDRRAYLQSRLAETSGREALVVPGSLRVTLDGDTLLLTGLAVNAATRQRLTEAAQQLAPDLRIENACVVDGTEGLSDGELMDRTGDWLRRTFGDEARHLGVMISRGRAHLRGTWPSIAAIKQAMAAIGALPGIRTVDASGVTLRHLMTLPDAGTMPLDGISVVNALEERLAKAGYRLGDWVDARNRRGTLVLVGIVDDERARKRVVEIASRLSGVRRVVDQLVTRSGSRDADEAVEQRIRHAWAASGCHVAPPDLHLCVIGDTAFVRGTEDTQDAKEKAIHLVRQDPAIRHVVDMVQVVTRRSRPA